MSRPPPLDGLPPFSCVSKTKCLSLKNTLMPAASLRHSSRSSDKRRLDFHWRHWQACACISPSVLACKTSSQVAAPDISWYDITVRWQVFPAPRTISDLYTANVLLTSAYRPSLAFSRVPVVHVFQCVLIPSSFVFACFLCFPCFLEFGPSFFSTGVVGCHC